MGTTSSTSADNSKFDSVGPPSGDTMLRGTKAASSGNSFVDAMDLGVEVRNEKGAPALTAAQAAKGHVDKLVRGGGLVVANTRMVGSRKGTTTGVSREEVVTLVNDLMREAAAFSGHEQTMQVVDTFRLLAYTRDIDTGKGERDIAYWFFLELHRFYPETCVRVLQMLCDAPVKNPYGSFLDYNKLYALCHADLTALGEASLAHAELETADDTEERARLTAIQDEIVRIYCVYLKEDMRALEAGEGVTLAAKWAPAVGSSVDKKCGLGKRLAAELFPPQGAGAPTERGTRWSQMTYRKNMSVLNKRVDPVEVKMCAKRFRDIDPKSVPSKALKKYNLALRNKTKKGEVRHPDDEDRTACAAAFEAAFEEARKNPTASRTIKAARLQGYELTEKYCSGGAFGAGTEDSGVEAQWAVLVESIRKKGKMIPGIAVCDTSGSMAGIPMQAGLALSYILADLSEGPWHNVMMTFSSVPQWVRFKDGDSLHAKMKKTPSIIENTNFEAAMELILGTAVENKVPAADMPAVLYVFTDMNFDVAQGTGMYGYGYGGARGGKYKTAYTALERKFHEHGYEVPHMVFWNLRANGTPTFQTETSQPNTSMMAGFNQGAFAAFMDGDASNLKEETPWDRLNRALDVERYDPILHACAETGEGFLAGYEVPPRPTDEGATGGAGVSGK